MNLRYFAYGLLVFVPSIQFSPTCLGARPNWRALSARPDDWYRSDEGLRLTDNILSHQSKTGSWPKNGDTTSSPNPEDASKITGTFDNGATIGEIRFLSRAVTVTRDPRVRDAVLKAIDHILEAQYPTGGWPQYFPPGRNYHRHLTFNDKTIVGLLELLRELSRSNSYAFIGRERREACANAFDRGIACILKCQIKVDGRLTVWCAQHDEISLEPRGGRTFEPVSLSGGESADILLLLMSLDTPSPEVVRAVHAGAAWFEKSKIVGIRLTVVDGDKKIVAEPKADPLWARFYQIETNRPIFCSRDGVIKYSLEDISHERRNGYSWYGTAGARVASRYRNWAQTYP